MKVLFIPVYIVTPHFETELELMLKHVNSGDEVYVLHCNENLYSCEHNPGHSKSLCYNCKSKFNNGTALINNIKILQYPELKMDFDILKNKFWDIEELKNYSIDKSNIGMGVASSLISRLNRDHELDTIKYQEEISITLKTAYYLLNVIKKISSKLIPDLVYIFNGRFATTLPLLLYCEQNNIPFYTHERGGKINKFCLFYKSIPHSVSYISQEIEEVWNSSLVNKELKEQIGATFFIDRRNRVIQAWYSFIAAQKNNLLPSSINSEGDKKIISIFNSTTEEYAAIRGSENAFLFNLDEHQYLSTIFEYFKDDKDVQFYLRIHPNLINTDNTQTKLLKEFKSKYNNVEIIDPESPIDTYALIENSDTIIVLGSTIGAEANYWGKPVIALRHAIYQDLDCCYWPNSIQDLFKLIKMDLNAKDRFGSIKYGYWELTRGIEFKYYKPETIFKGQFLNEDISLKSYQKMFFYLERSFEFKSLNALLKAIFGKFFK